MKISIFFILFILFLSSCKKSKNDSNEPIGLLTTKAWKPAANDINPSTNPTGLGNTTYYPIMECVTDDIYNFSAGNKLSIKSGIIKCNSNEPSSELTDYSIDFTTKKITVKGIEYQLAELSTSQLKYYSIIQGGSLLYVYHH